MEARDVNGLRVLHEAAAGGHEDCALLLIAANCDLGSQDANGAVVLHDTRCEYRFQVRLPCTLPQ